LFACACIPMTLDQLRSLAAIGKHLNFRRAAAELHLTQSAVSKQLISLQKELGAKLYTHHGAIIEITEAGHAALSKIEFINKQVEELREMFQGRTGRDKQAAILSVGAAFSIAGNVLPTIIARFEKTHPDFEVRCHTGSSQQIQQLIRDGLAELGLSTYFSLSEDIASEPFRVQMLAFFVSARHPLATKRHITLSDVLAYPLVVRGFMGGPTWSQDILRQFSERGFKYKIAVECNGPLQVKESVARNMGVGLSYMDNLKADVANKRFVVLKGADFNFTTLSYILYSKKRGLSPAAHEFLALLRQAKSVPKSTKLNGITGQSILIAPNRPQDKHRKRLTNVPKM